MKENQMKQTQKFFDKDFSQFQGALDAWAKGSYAWVKGETKKFMAKDHKKMFFESLEKNETYLSFRDSYHVRKALSAGASHQLPFATLKLLGSKLAQDSTKAEFREIIQQNVLKHKGEFIKLDDLQNQKKAQKAIKNFKAAIHSVEEAA